MIPGLNAKLPLELSEAAIQQMHNLVKSKENPSDAAIRISISTKGCSGLSYSFDIVDCAEPSDQKYFIKDLNIYIDSKALIFICGTRIDFVEDKISAGFVFNNPNEKGKCGCGKSFYA